MRTYLAGTNGSAMTLLKNFFTSDPCDYMVPYVLLPDKCKEKNSTSNKVIILLDETRLDEMGLIHLCGVYI